MYIDIDINIDIDIDIDTDIDHSGDFGLGFFGNALESGVHLVEHPTLGGSLSIYLSKYVYIDI